MEIYVVKSGDTTAGIAGNFGISEARLIFDNGIERPDILVPGQALIILKPEQVYTIRPGDTLF